MKKEFKIIIAAILAVWIFIMGIEVGVLKQKKADANSTTTTASAPTITTEPTQPTTKETEPSTTAPTEPSTQASEPSEEPSAPVANTDVSESAPASDPTESQPAAPSDDPSSLTKEQVLEKVTAYMAQVKAEQNMTAKKNEKINVNLTALSIEAARGIVNNIIQGIVGDGPSETTYTFSGGQATDPDGNAVTPNAVIPPTNKPFALTDAGVKEAKAEKVGDNTVYTIILVEESTTLESPEPTHNAAAIGYLNLAGLDVSPAQITKADMKYPGSKVVLTVDANDKVIGLKNELPMTGKGEAKVIGMSGNADFEGALDEEWVFTY